MKGPEVLSFLRQGIKGNLGEIRIELKPDANTIKIRPYQLNPRVKEKVKEEIDKMLATRLIFRVRLEKSNSNQDKNTGGIGLILCVDLRGLNAACIHDPFPTPFQDEVLDHAVGKEAYSFTDGFSGYHQVQIAEE
jgi:hypothetical protein